MSDAMHFIFYTNIDTKIGIIKFISYDRAFLKARDQEVYQNIFNKIITEINIFDTIYEFEPLEYDNNTKEAVLWILFKESLTEDIIKKAISLYQKPIHISKSPKFKIETTNLEEFEAHDFVKGVMPLIMELFDENTNVDKIYSLIVGMPSLQEDILALVNSAYLNKGIEIKDIKSAIVRIGLSRFRDFTLRSISKEALQKLEEEPKNLYDLEATLILQTSIFDNLCSLICSDVKRTYDFIILSMMDGFLIILDYLSKQNQEDALNLQNLMLKIIKKPSLIYSYITRLVEKDNFGKDILSIDKEYLSKVFGYSFQAIDTINAIIIGYSTFEPMYSFETIEKINVLKQTIKMGFALYLSILGTKFILEDDKRSGLIMQHRLERFGLGSFLAFLNKCILDANTTLRDLGIKKEIYKVSSRPDYEFSLSENNRELPKALKDFYANFIVKIRQRKLCIRYEDYKYTMIKLEKAINFLKETQKGSINIFDLNVCELPSYEDLSFLDIVIISNIDRVEDVGKFKSILKNFEGYLILTLRNDLDLEKENKVLFDEIKDLTIDFPSYMEDIDMYNDMVETAKDMFSGYLDVSTYVSLDKRYDLKSLMRLMLDNI